MNDVKPLVDMLRSKSPCHSIRVNTAGNWDAPIVIVGEDFGEHKNNDAMYQWPFGSLNGNGCSFWLAREDRKSTRLTPVTNAHLVCRLLLEKKKIKTRSNNE